MLASKSSLKLESLAYRLRDLDSLRKLFEELNFEFSDDPVSKSGWTDEEKNAIRESEIVAKKFGYRVYYLKTRENTFKHLKTIASKIIKADKGMCLVCSHNPDGFKWIFSILSNNFSVSFNETRHLPLEIHHDTKISKPFIKFLEDIRVPKNSDMTTLQAQIVNAFDMFAVEIHDELTENVFEALKTLSEGIIKHKSNNLKLTEDALELIREPVLILLYRVIFVLYAEDRGVFPIDHETYYTMYSMKYIKNEWILNNIKLTDGAVQDRLMHLFDLIEKGNKKPGHNKDDFEMRSYYGRLFDSNIHNDLTVWKIPNKNLLEAINLLTRTKDKNGDYFFLDYAALETIHLGAIYERLLEYRLSTHNNKIFSLADAKERKASGSYYTPKPIVDHIVRHTIGPLIENCCKTSQTHETALEKIFSLKILDPAMGSGHFLVGATNYMAKCICDIEKNTDEQHYIERKRDVVRQCIYGVDINPLAVDLAMVTLWLETLSSEKPLSFLSAHLKCGNSLVGSTIDSIFDKQTTLEESIKSREGIREIVKKFLSFEKDDSTAEIVKTKTINYQQMQEKGTVYHDLKVLLDFKTAEAFGHSIPNLGDYRAKIGEGTLDYRGSGKAEEAGRLAADLGFFHWELEFPGVYYDKQGKRKSNIGVDLSGSMGGFDAVIGNPPWERVQVSDDDFFRPLYFRETQKAWSALSKSAKEAFIAKVLRDPGSRVMYTKAKNHVRVLRKYFTKKYIAQGGGTTELFKLFTERAFCLLNNNSLCGINIPSAIYNDKQCAELRKIMFGQTSILHILSFINTKSIFKDIHRQFNFCIVIFQSGGLTHNFGLSYKLTDLTEINQKPLLNLEVDLIKQISGDSMTVLEANYFDYDIIKKMRRFPTLGSNQWELMATREFDMSLDKDLFQSDRTKTSFPLYEGKTIGQFNIDGPVNYYVERSLGRKRLLDTELRRIKKAQTKFKFLNAPAPVADCDLHRLVWRKISNAVDYRTMYASIIPCNVFCGDSLWAARPRILTSAGKYSRQHTDQELGYICGVFNSLPFDWYVRPMVRLNLTKTILDTAPVPKFDANNSHHLTISKLSIALLCESNQHSELRKKLKVKTINTHTKTTG